MGFDFAAIQNGELCFCAQKFGSYGASLSCNKTCSGDANVFCGGKNANNVYNASYYRNKLLIFDSGEWELFSSVNLTLKLQNSSNTNPAFSGDFGDGNGYSPGLIGWQRYVPVVWGSFVFKARLFGNGPVREVSLEKYISATVKHGFLDCPSVVATEEEIKCIAGVYQGTEINATLSVGHVDGINVSLPGENWVLSVF